MTSTQKCLYCISISKFNAMSVILNTAGISVFFSSLKMYSNAHTCIVKRLLIGHRIYNMN